MLHFVFLWHLCLMFSMAIGEAEKCLAGCQVTNHSSIRVLFHSSNHLGAFGVLKKIGWICLY